MILITSSKFRTSSASDAREDADFVTSLEAEAIQLKLSVAKASFFVICLLIPLEHALASDTNSLTALASERCKMIRYQMNTEIFHQDKYFYFLCVIGDFVVQKLLAYRQ